MALATGYAPVAVERFGGLNLSDDPQEVGWNGAIDCLNVDFDRRGRLRSRDGYAKLNSVANANAIKGLAVYHRSAASDLLVIGDTGNRLRAYDTSGVLQATSAATAGVDGFLAIPFGTDTAERMYIANAAERVWRLENTTFTLLGAGPTPTAGLAVTPWDNRLVYLATNGETSRIEFSDPGAPETVGANNYVRLTPGDGQRITAGVSWRDMVFVFKPDRFYVVYGTSTDSSGNPVFNYRTVDAGKGAGAASVLYDPSSRPCCSTPYGVAFAHTSGIYLTTGGPPVSISEALSPLFEGYLPPYFTGISQPFLADDMAQTNLAFHAGRLYVSVNYATAASKYTWVYDFEQKAWMLFNLPARQMAGYEDAAGGLMYFHVPTTHASATRILYQGNPLYAQTTDDGSAISTRYRSGFSDLGAPGNNRKVVRQWSLRGSGTVTFGVASDDAVAIPTTNGGAQASVDLTGARPNYRTSAMGENFSWQVSAASGAWRLDEVVAEVA